MPPSYAELCELLGFPVPRSYARFVERMIPDATEEFWNPTEFAIQQMHDAGPTAISIAKPGDTHVFGCDAGGNQFVFVMDDEGNDDRERPIAFCPLDGQTGVGLLANSFPEFLEWLVANQKRQVPNDSETERLEALARQEFGIATFRSEEKIVETARRMRMMRKDVFPTQDQVGVALPHDSVDRKYLARIQIVFDNEWKIPNDPTLLEEADRRLARGEPGTALCIARDYRFWYWYDDWTTTWEIIRRTNDILVAAYQLLGRPKAAAEIERQTEWNLANVT